MSGTVNHQVLAPEEIARQIAQYMDAKDPYPTADHEAYELLRTMSRTGESVDDIHELIDVSPAQARYLYVLAEGDALRVETVRRAIEFRQKVRASFDRQLAHPGIEVHL